MDSWIYIIIFVVVPIINRLIEMNKARAEKAAAETKRMMRKERRKKAEQEQDKEQDRMSGESPQSTRGHPAAALPAKRPATWPAAVKSLLPIGQQVSTR